jgi:hypothetical protein
MTATLSRSRLRLLASGWELTSHPDELGQERLNEKRYI